MIVFQPLRKIVKSIHDDIAAYTSHFASGVALSQTLSLAFAAHDRVGAQSECQTVSRRKLRVVVLGFYIEKLVLIARRPFRQDQR